MSELRYLNEAGFLESVTLGATPTVIGRAASCQIVLDSEMISREHARVEVEPDGRFKIRDLGSRNKTLVCGQQIAETILDYGDIIRVGDRVLEYLDDRWDRKKPDLDFLTPDREEPPHCEWLKIKTPFSLTGKQVERLSRLQAGNRVTARPEDVAEGALVQAIIEFGAERGFVALRGDGKRDLRPIAQRGLTRHARGSLVPVSQSFVFSAVLQSVAGRYPMTTGQVDSKSGYAATALVAPLTYQGDILGLIYIDRPATKKPFPDGNTAHFAAVGAYLGSLMAETARRLSESATREGAAWIATAQRLQASLDGRPEDGEGFEVRTKRFPGRARCGDVWDVIHLGEGRTVVVMIDAGGHGVIGLAQAAAIRGSIRTALAASDETVTDPAPMFGSLNAMIASSPTRQVVACTYVAVDLASGRMTYINAGGMPPLLMVAAGRLITLDQPSLVLGVDSSYEYQASTVDFPEPCRLVCFSDGLAEATNSGGDAVGSEHIHEALLQQEAFAEPDAAVEALSKLITTHLAGAEPDDDASILVIGRGQV